MAQAAMTVAQLTEELARWSPDAPVMIHPTGDPDDAPVPLSHLGRGAVLGDRPEPYPLLVAGPVTP